MGLTYFGQGYTSTSKINIVIVPRYLFKVKRLRDRGNQKQFFMKKLFLISIVCATITVHAQFKFLSNGNAGLATTNPLTTLQIYDDYTKTCTAQEWQWAASGGSRAQESAKYVAVDQDENVYVVGEYEEIPGPYGDATYGVFGSDTIPYYGESQTFLIKYSNTGTVLWSKSLGGNALTGKKIPLAMTFDTTSNCLYLIGSYNGTMILGNDTLTGSMGRYLTKIDVNGNYIWTKNLPYLPYVLKTDNLGMLYIAAKNIRFTTIHIDTFSIVPNKRFIAKFNPNGECVAVNQNFEHIYFEKCIVKNQYLFIKGSTDSTVIQCDTVHASFQHNNHNGIIACFDTSTLHVKRISYLTTIADTADIYNTDFCVDSAFNTYIVGQFFRNICFGPDTFTTYPYSDLFIVKYDSNGTYQWAKRGNYTPGEIGDNLLCSALKNGDFYVAGIYVGSNLHLGNYVLSFSGHFVARFNPLGDCVNYFLSNFDGTKSGIYGFKVLEVDNNDNLIIAGGLSGGTCYFDNIALTNTYNPYPGIGYNAGDMLVAKHNFLTGGEEKMLNTNNRLVIFANPNSGKCNIIIPDEFKTEQELSLQILDNHGKIIQQNSVQLIDNHIKVNITMEAKGMYHAILTNGKKIYTGKIVFE